MKQPTIWFNTGFKLVHVIQRIREAQEPGEIFRIVCSHKKQVPAKEVADLFESEPPGLDDAGYMEYCLDLARRHAVDVFIPSTRVLALAAAQDRFQAAGVRLIVPADPGTLTLLKNKVDLYQAIPAKLVPMPDYKLVSDLAGFRQACSQLSTRYETICFKPAAGIAGQGFRIVSDKGSGFAGPVNGEHPPLTPAGAEQYLIGKTQFPTLMVMPYLTGLERSIDCLASGGKLIRSIVRVKYRDGLSELIEDNRYLEELASRLTAHLKLNGLYNIQFMEHDGAQYLLEINARMSGGIHYGALSGVFLPYWAVRLALGNAGPADIPQPRTGVRVVCLSQPLVS